MSAFLLALIHRAWTLDREDDLTEDAEDRSVRRRLARGEQEDEEELDTTGCENVTPTRSRRRPGPRGGGAPGEDGR